LTEASLPSAMPTTQRCDAPPDTTMPTGSPLLSRVVLVFQLVRVWFRACGPVAGVEGFLGCVDGLGQLWPGGRYWWPDLPGCLVGCGCCGPAQAVVAAVRFGSMPSPVSCRSCFPGSVGRRGWFLPQTRMSS